MWRWVVAWQATVLFASATLDLGFLGNRRYHASSQFDCFDYPSAMPLRSFDSGWRLPRKLMKISSSTPRYGNIISTRKIDLLLPNRDDIVKEHAKLVQDINSLRQVMFVAPLADESRDYEDSIFHEILETSTTTTSRPTTTRITRPTKNGIPIIVLGGSSNKHVVKSQPIKIPKQTISLVGTSVSPLVRHPYPFIMAASSRAPVRICMSSPVYTTTTRRPSLWDRLIKSIVPR